MKRTAITTRDGPGLDPSRFLRLATRRLPMIALVPLLSATVAFGQNVGDLVVMQRQTDLKLGSQTVATLKPGYSAIVENVQGNWLWIGKPEEGWVDRQDVVAVRSEKVFRSRLGFTLTYPPDWTPASKELTAEMVDQALEKFPDLKNFNLDEVAVMVFDPYSSDFRESLNVVHSEGVLPATEDAARSYADGLKASEEKSHLKMTVTNSGVFDMGERPACFVEFDVISPLNAKPVHTWSVVTSGKHNSFVLTCTALTEDFEWYRPLFERMLKTFRLAADR